VRYRLSMTPPEKAEGKSSPHATAGAATECSDSGTGTKNLEGTECYLDMDGLLADLFDAVSDRVHSKKYAETSDEERETTRELWTAKTRFSKAIGEVEEVFASLSPYPSNRDLLDIVCARFGGFHICSHPARIDRDGCIRGKKRWIEQHITPSHGKFLRGVHFPDMKEEFATTNGRPNLLVDDYTPYVEAWRQAGGVAIRVRSDQFPGGEGFRDHFLEELDKLGF
jgi:hypothetical protein